MAAVQFAKMQEEKGRSVLLTAQQEEWLTIQRMVADTNLKVGCDHGSVLRHTAHCTLCISKVTQLIWVL